MTAPWSPLLTRILRVVDAISSWTEAVIEFLYLETNGQVDKPLPSEGDILAVYLVEGRLFSESPQGWYIIKAKKLKIRDVRQNPHFWCQCLFQSDIPPVPDCAVPWRGRVDPWELRDRLQNRPIWVRLCATEISGCSYYNLSDWIRAKRDLYDGRSRKESRFIRRVIMDDVEESPEKKKRRRRPSRLTEYIRFESASSDSSTVDCLQRRLPIARLIPCEAARLVTTGKMSHGAEEPSSALTTASSSPSISHRNGMMSLPRYMAATTSSWLQLRQDTKDSILKAIMMKLSANDRNETWTMEVSHRLEEEAVFEKCMRNRDRYEGLSRAVLGIIERFESILDSIEMLIAIGPDLRDEIIKGPEPENPEPLFLFEHPFIR